MQRIHLATELMRPNGSPITQERWLEIQDNAKAAARLAIQTGDTSDLTALGKAYYEVFTKGHPWDMKASSV